MAFITFAVEQAVQKFAKKLGKLMVFQDEGNVGTLWSALKLSEALWSSLELSGALWSSLALCALHARVNTSIYIYITHSNMSYFKLLWGRDLLKSFSSSNSDQPTQCSGARRGQCRYVRVKCLQSWPSGGVAMGGETLLWMLYVGVSVQLGELSWWSCRSSATLV